MSTIKREQRIEYINGFLEATSRVKDILTHNLGGFNQFISIDKNNNLDVLSNLKNYIISNKPYYDKYFIEAERFEKMLDDIQLSPIANWITTLPKLISVWTCDAVLTSIHGRNGYPLSEYLVNFLLKDFFNQFESEVILYKLLPEYGIWHWGDLMGEEYVFETSARMYILHFGEST
ncbi:hypothetical protein [Niastella sp. OAS944]|uniref:hypothetical protein n=1 Tax=Niastella sp. OAS944 TaxID=2664089 RepID=UPI00347323A8|nr:hypothetical protein [Chitinophagaceae bacterium OAS944]